MRSNRLLTDRPTAGTGWSNRSREWSTAGQKGCLAVWLRRQREMLGFARLFTQVVRPSVQGFGFRVLSLGFKGFQREMLGFARLFTQVLRPFVQVSGLRV